MNKDYTYIGFVCIDNNQLRLITKTNSKYNISGIDGSDSLIDVNLLENEALYVSVKFFDGTESVTLENARNRNYEDIIFVIESYGIVVSDIDHQIFKMVYDDFNELNFFWGLIEEYFETEKGKENFEIFENKNNWN